MNEQGKATFGEDFRLVHRMTWAPFGNGLAGNLDMVVPLAATGAADMEEFHGSAFFLQHGVTRWTDKHGLRRNDLRLGTAYRFTLPSFTSADADVFGVSALVQENIERGHQRLVLGTDYASGWGAAGLHHYIPTTDWRRGRSGYEERAAGGTEFNLRLDLTTTLSVNTAVGRWERDGAGQSTVDGRLGIGWRPHPYVRLHARAGGRPRCGFRCVQAVVERPVRRIAQAPEMGGPRHLRSGCHIERPRHVAPGRERGTDPDH